MNAVTGAEGGASPGQAAPGEEIADVQRIQTRLDSLVYALSTEPTGEPRPDTHLRACIDGVRAALDCFANGETVEADAGAGCSLVPGMILANAYQVRALIGTGGMAEVYQVRHRDLRTDYAVKILKAERARDPLVVDLFIAEARALLSLRHDGIVRAHALLRHGDGRPFLVLDLARGPTLAAALKAGPLDPSDFRAVAYRLAASLEALHANGLVHGDLSAENVVMVGGIEGAVLLDLGLARSTGSDAFAFAGKWSIAAPEQLDGMPVTSACDMYALGLILAAAASGARLVMGHDQASARSARRAPLLLDGVPRPLSAMLQRLLDPDPARRPAAGAVAKRFAGVKPAWGAAFRDAVAEVNALHALRRLRQRAPGSRLEVAEVDGSNTA